MIQPPHLWMFSCGQLNKHVSSSVSCAGCIWKHKIIIDFIQYGQMSFLCTVHRKLCYLHRFLCTVHIHFFHIFGKMLNSHLEPRTKIQAHYKGSECEIAFLKFHFLLDIIMWKLWLINSRRKWNFEKAISHSEPL